MVRCSKKTREGWVLVDDMVRRWMQQRIQLTQDFENIAAPTELEKSKVALVPRISAFCQTLVDYVSAGHFEIYDELITEAREFDDGSLSTGLGLCKTIENSTDLALEFNDKYENSANFHERIHELPRDMVELGSMLNFRFELEDKLIATVHDCHRPLVA